MQVLGDNLLSLIKAYSYRNIPLHLVKHIANQVHIHLLMQPIGKRALMSFGSHVGKHMRSAGHPAGRIRLAAARMQAHVAELALCFNVSSGLLASVLAASNMRPAGMCCHNALFPHVSPTPAFSAALTAPAVHCRS